MEKQLTKIIENIEKYKSVDNVHLVGVSKYRSVEDIKKLYDLGIKDLGENRPQEFRDKYDLLPHDIRWHLIGRLQANKIKYLIGKVYLIHSVADVKLLAEIDEAALRAGEVMNILLQVNTANEESKQGFNEKDLKDALQYASTLSHVKVLGLMCMAPIADDIIVEQTFLKAKEWYDKYNTGEFKYLSMGMSNDYIIALKCGSNMLRIGSLLFEED